MLNIETQGYLLAAEPYQEYDALVSLFTPEQGLLRGLVKGGLSRAKRSHLQVGNALSIRWSARLADQLGRVELSTEVSWPGRVMDSSLRLLALASLCDLLNATLSERQAEPEIYEGLGGWLETLPSPYWGEALVVFELELLRCLGFGLDLTRCAVTGQRHDLAYVSPRSGRAVSLAVAQPYAERLLVLPGFLSGQAQSGAEALCQGLELTGHFFAKHLFYPREQDLPPSRALLLRRLAATRTGQS